jgi:hypothetical protein
LQRLEEVEWMLIEILISGGCVSRRAAQLESAEPEILAVRWMKSEEDKGAKPRKQNEEQKNILRELIPEGGFDLG